MLRLALSTIAIAALCGVADRACAQYVPPGGPTLPIELDYFRPPQGVLDNYNQFVAPRQRLANQLQAIERRQVSDFRALNREINQTQKNVRESQAAATGTSAGFMNYSHYYNLGGQARGPVRRR